MKKLIFLLRIYRQNISASQDFAKNFEVKSSGVDYKEVKYLSGDGKEIKGWGGKIKVRA